MNDSPMESGDLLEQTRSLDMQKEAAGAVFSFRPNLNLLANFRR
jgi:hypothetical protein